MNKIALAIHDLSCYSKSSLTVVIPVLEAMGVECAVLPTALLSTQTDGFESYFFQDETSAMRSIVEKHKELNIEFDGIYSGFLGSCEQIEIVETLLKDHKKSLKLVDPVLGDNGELYSAMSLEHVKKMKRLVALADVMTPNYTEALLLSGLDYIDGLTQKDISVLVDAMRKLGPEKGVVTSVPLALGMKGNIAYSEEGARIFTFEQSDLSYPGSGDLFASILFSYYLNTTSFFSSAALATELSSEAVFCSRRDGREKRMGVALGSVFTSLKRKVL